MEEKTTPVEHALAPPDAVRRRDALAAIAVTVREGAYRITATDADLLLGELEAIGKRTNFDRLLYQAVWRLLAEAPPHERLRRISRTFAGTPGAVCRGDAVRYLLRSYPESRAEMLAEHGDDPDPNVQDAIAHALAGDDPRAAVEHWERAAAGAVVPHDLAETIPACLAALGNKDDHLRWQRFDREAGGGTLYGIAAALMEEREAGGE